MVEAKLATPPEFATDTPKVFASRQPRPHLFWRGGGNQFLEAPILAQWIKHGIESSFCRVEMGAAGSGRYPGEMSSGLGPVSASDRLRPLHPLCRWSDFTGARHMTPL